MVTIIRLVHKRSMNIILDSINNRDKAILIWLLIILFVFLLKKDIRKGFWGVLNALTNTKVLVILFSMVFYVAAWVYIFYRISFWNVSFLKDTLAWFFGSAFVLFINIPKATKEEQFFKNTLFNTFKWAIILEFIANLYVFNFFLELIILPLLAVVVITTHSLDHPKFKDIENRNYIKNILNYVSATAGLALLSYSIANAIADFQKFATLNNLFTFLLPLVLTLAFIPYLYIMALLFMYEDIFTRSNHWLRKNKELARYLRSRVFIACHISLRKLKSFSREMNFMQMKSRNDICAEMREFEIKYKNRKNLPLA
jgi:hypothetical protein